MDFLSYLSLKDNPSPSIDTTVLNSVANLQKALQFLESHKTVHAFLDNDESGKKALGQMNQLLPKSEVVDQSHFYRSHKDLNDYWRDNQPRKKQQIPVRKESRGPKFGLSKTSTVSGVKQVYVLCTTKLRLTAQTCSARPATVTGRTPAIPLVSAGENKNKAR